MYAKELILSQLDTSGHIINAYVGDLSDAELKERPAPGLNPIAWQLGHLISAERNMVEPLKPGSCPTLPEGFNEVHGKDAAKSDDTSSYLRWSEYRSLWDAQRAATKAVLASLSEDDLKATPPNTFGGMCPTVGHVISFTAGHVQMHVGQFVPLRRKAGKPIVI
jgi:hypothetical protein